jgi:hypothetical protein
LETIKAETYLDVPRYFTGIVEWTNGYKQWYKKGMLHREEGPAVEYEDEEYNEWHLNGVYYNSVEEYFEALTPEQRLKFVWSEYFANH